MVRELPDGTILLANGFGRWEFPNRQKLYKHQFLCSHPRVYEYRVGEYMEGTCLRCGKDLERRKVDDFAAQTWADDGGPC